MPIWPKTTIAKAALFNKYGRGILHMGLHEGEEAFEYDRGGRSRRRKPRKYVNVLEVTMNLDSIEAAIDLAPVRMVSVEVIGRGNTSAYAFNGTGDDWQLIQFMLITGDFGPVVMWDLKSRLSTTAATQIVAFALVIDGVIDKTSVVRYRFTTVGNAHGPQGKTVCYPVPGEHTFQLAYVAETAVTVQVLRASTVLRLTGLIERGGE